MTRPSLYQCWACGRRTPKIGIMEIEAGWEKFQGRVGFGASMTSITLTHCPVHREGFVQAIAKRLMEVFK